VSSNESDELYIFVMILEYIMKMHDLQYHAFSEKLPGILQMKGFWTKNTRMGNLKKFGSFHSDFLLTREYPGGKEYQYN
jgi:hypothetical protein